MRRPPNAKLNGLSRTVSVTDQRYENVNACFRHKKTSRMAGFFDMLFVSVRCIRLRLVPDGNLQSCPSGRDPS